MKRGDWIKLATNLAFPDLTGSNSELPFWRANLLVLISAMLEMINRLAQKLETPCPVKFGNKNSDISAKQLPDMKRIILSPNYDGSHGDEGNKINEQVLRISRPVWHLTTRACATNATLNSPLSTMAARRLLAISGVNGLIKIGVG